MTATIQPVTAGPDDAFDALASLWKFVVTGGLSYLIDVATLSFALFVLDLSVTLSTTLAYLAAFVVNFGLNRVWTFPGGAGARRQMVRYLVLVVVNYVLTLLLMLALTGSGANAVIAKTVTTAAVAAANFIVYRRWVFA